MKTSPSTLLSVTLAVSPPGTRQTMTARSRTIAMLRRCLLRSGPTARKRYLRRDCLGLGRCGRGHGPPCRGRHGAIGRLGREAVADAEVRVDVAPARRRLLELLAQLADEDVDRAVAVDHRVAPDPLVDLL